MGSEWRLTTLNASGWSQLRAFIEYTWSMAGTFHVLAAQELHLTHQKLAEAQNWLRQRGLRIHACAAVPSVGGGTTGGTAIIVPSHIGMGTRESQLAEPVSYTHLTLPTILLV
eukprot:3824029-Amphidinium_carterae.1